MIIDEIHLLGADRGPVLEVIISRMRCAKECAWVCVGGWVVGGQVDAHEGLLGAGWLVG